MSNFQHSNANVKNCIEMWARLLRQPPSALHPSTDIVAWADSITLMRFQSLILRNFGMKISLQILINCRTIENQAHALGEKTFSPEVAVASLSTRKGPPGMLEMAHAHGIPARIEQLKAAANPILDSLGLSWDRDVENVIPLYDFGHILVRCKRLRSWSLRFAIIAKSADANKLQNCFKLVVARHALLRAVAFRSDPETLVHLAMRPNESWFKVALTGGYAVETPEDLLTFKMNDDKLDHAAAPGPLFRAMVVHVQSTGTAGLVYNGQHSILDALTMQSFMEDLDVCLEHGVGHLPQRPPYKLFADMYHLHRDGVLAQINVDYHVSRLRGISSLGDCFWPRRRAPHWFKGDDSGWMSADGSLGLPEERKPLDPPDKRRGTNGISRTKQFPNLRRLKVEYGIEPPVVFKAILALVNARLTGQ